MFTARRDVPARSKVAPVGLGAFLLLASLSLAPAAGMAGVDDAPPGWQPVDLLAKGKMEADLGRFDAAIAAFTAAVESKDSTPGQRIEALVRLGAARRASGDAEGALQAFLRASRDPALDMDSKALLLRGVGGVVPGRERWEAVWSRVTFAVDRSAPGGPRLDAVWPDVPPKGHLAGDPMSLDFEDGDLQDIFRLFADFSGLNVVVFPGTSGRASLKVVKEPWPDVLQRILAANGYTYELNDNVLLIGPPELLGPPRSFTGARIDVEWGPNADPANPGRGLGLAEAFDEIAAAGGARVDLAAGVGGRVVLKLVGVRWDQAFDVLARVNGLDWRPEGKTLKVFPRARPATR